MPKHCLNVCKLRPCLTTESTNSARMHTIVIAALQQQYLQTELTFWIPYVQHQNPLTFHGPCLNDQHFPNAMHDQCYLTHGDDNFSQQSAPVSHIHFWL